MGRRRRRRGAAVAAVAALAIVLSAGAASAATPDTKVVGGTAATNAQYPWQVALALNPARWQGDAYARQVCGGSLIAPTIVITAAHCVYNLPTDGIGFNPPAEFEVFTGRTFLRQAAGQVIGVSNIYVPVAGASASGKAKVEFARAGAPTPGASPLYNPVTHEYDVALLQLTGPSSSPLIQIAGPDEGATWAGGRPATVSGWGSVNPPHAVPVKPDQLQATGLTMVDDATCGTSRTPYFFPATMVCAGVPEGGRGACYGDSGGPLVVPVEHGASTGFRLAGLTSLVGAADTCGTPYPDMYARLASDPIRTFVQTAVSQLTGVNPIGFGARPVEPPETKIGKPKFTRRKAKFSFTASEPATFQCKINKRPFAPCGPKTSYRLRVGRHKLRVVAIDALGQADPTPDVVRWRVRRR